MIITTLKPEDEIFRMVGGFKKLFLVGCGTCATECKTGGEDEVKAFKSRLENYGKKVTGYIIVESVCDQRLTRLDLKRNNANVEESDAILVLACGTATQTVAELSGKITIPACNTQFIGTIERIGRYYERCRACGDCVLYETGGICPIARCGKSLLNGPCGGQAKGKCEVGGWKNDCAWILIYNRLRDEGRLDLYRKYRPPKDYSQMTSAREVVFR
ncbi:MAG: methylenetetrahydrofolate reductase C-terminal domain-containing protein [Candidatus Bathyarchaeia archaeon]|nr:methylenetetrahydrofolate reductase C-terminal domain-containing protein [Candidatus Bathyarchaeota archaeon]